MDFDFRFRNSEGKWESTGHCKGADREAAFRGLTERTTRPMPAGRYMSRPRGRQRDWDLFWLDQQGNITQADKGWLEKPQQPSGFAIGSRF